MCYSRPPVVSTPTLRGVLPYRRLHFGPYSLYMAHVGLKVILIYLESLICLLVRQTGYDHASVARFPVLGRGDFVSGGELEGFDDAHNLVEISPRGGRVQQRQFQLFVRADDENTAGR